MAALLLLGCAVTQPPGLGTEEAAIVRERAYLLPPTTGYPLALAPGRERQIFEAYEALVEERQVGVARSLAGELLRRTPGLHPARLVLGQADLVEGDPAGALERLDPLLAELPGWTAARLLHARAAELVLDLPLAYGSYLELAGESGAARDRLLELRPRVVEIVARRIQEALRRGRPEEAAADLERLEAWAPGEDATLRSAARVAAARGEAATELRLVRELSRRHPEDRDLRVREADLELEVGDAGRGLRTLQQLAAEDPEDRELGEKLGRARFLWRLQLLPPEARELTRMPELTRGDFAALLYWLFPSVRYGPVDGGTIANDVFDHPAREEIVRVINQGLMTVDATLHRFEPDRPLARAEALRSLLALLDQRQPRLACFGSAPRATTRLPVAAICRLASQCGLIGEEAECLPEATVGGGNLVDLARTALAQLGIE